MWLILACCTAAYCMVACSFGRAEGGGSHLIFGEFDEEETPGGSALNDGSELSGSGEGLFSSSLLGGAPGILEGSGGSGSAQGSGGSIQLAQISEFCGDFIRDVVLEDCDAGPEGSPACNSVCQVLDFLLVEPPDVAEPPLIREQRVLGEGRHPSAGNAEMQAVAFMDRSDPNVTGHVGVQLLDAWGNREAIIDVAADVQPAFSAHPVLAALPDGTFAAAWNDRSIDGAALGVALRKVAAEEPFLSDARAANQTAFGAQYDPDLLVVGDELVVAWTDAGIPFEGPHVMARVFDENLEPVDDEMVMGGSGLPEGNAVLANLGDSWAASWRESQPDGSERIVVFSGGAKWFIDVDAPGPAADKPALVALDEDRLLVVFTVGTDPLETGTANTPRLEAAVVDTLGSTVDLLGSVEPLSPEYEGSSLDVLAIGQSQPALVSVHAQIFLSWMSDPVLGDAGGRHLWLKELVWDEIEEELLLDEPEISLARWEEHRMGDQMRPALAASPVTAEGALLMAWEDRGLSLHPGQGRPDVVAQVAPVPLRRGPPVLSVPEWLIDDLEDGDDWIIEHEGRIGEWYFYSDETGTGDFEPDGPGRASDFAARMTGSGFTSWGAGMGFDLNNAGTGKDTYDASDSIGITFWARAASTETIRFNVSDVGTDPDGSICTSCFDHHGIDVELTTSWVQYTFTWAQLSQLGWGDALVLDPSQLYALLFQVGANTTFDIWIDDVSFVPDFTELIDDLESGDGSLPGLSGRQGEWFTYNDGSMGGTQTPAEGTPFSPDSPGFDSSSYAARTFGSGFTSWGASMAVELNNDGTKDTYDASAYIGVSFWARASGTLPIRFNVADGNTDPDGGVCTNCFDHFGADLTLESSWQRYTFTWWQLDQQGWGEPFGVIDIERIYALHFQTPPSQSFDVWVDDVMFIVGGGPL